MKNIADDYSVVLKVTKIPPRIPVWPWAPAIFGVYRKLGEGIEEEVVTGEFRNKAEALAVARALLAKSRLARC